MFAVGQEIECITDEWDICRTSCAPNTLIPKKGEIYHCAGYVDPTQHGWKKTAHNPWLRLQESTDRTFYFAGYFRAVTKRTTSIEVFKKMETPRTKELEPA